MCFCLLPVTDSDLNFALAAKEWASRFHYFLAIFLKFSPSIISDTKMASGSAPAGERRVQIRPLLPEGEVPRGRDMRLAHNS